MYANLIVKHTDANAKQTTESYTLNPSKVAVSGGHIVDSDTAVVIDTFARATVGLSTDTYQDTEIRAYDSVNEILAE